MSPKQETLTIPVTNWEENFKLKTDLNFWKQICDNIFSITGGLEQKNRPWHFEPDLTWLTTFDNAHLYGHLNVYTNCPTLKNLVP